jgi:penicillin amidase
MDTDLDGVAMDADSVLAGARAARRTALARALYDHPALRELRSPTGYDPFFLPWLDPLARMGSAASALSAHLGVSVPDQPSGRWGDRHVLLPVLMPGLEFDMPRVELSGDGDCVLATHSIAGVTDVCWRGPVLRYVWEFGGESRGRWIVPFGASDRPEDPHFLDQLPLWAAGELVPIVTDWSLLTPEELTPAGAG